MQPQKTKGCVEYIEILFQKKVAIIVFLNVAGQDDYNYRCKKFGVSRFATVFWSLCTVALCNDVIKSYFVTENNLKTYAIRYYNNNDVTCQATSEIFLARKA